MNHLERNEIAKKLSTQPKLDSIDSVGSVSIKRLLMKTIESKESTLNECRVST